MSAVNRAKQVSSRAASTKRMIARRFVRVFRPPITAFFAAACRVRAVEFFVAAERVASLVNLMLVARLRVLLVGARNLDVCLYFLIAVSVARR